MGIQVVTNKVFSEAQKGAILKYIDCLDKNTICSRPKKFLETFN